MNIEGHGSWKQWEKWMKCDAKGTTASYDNLPLRFIVVIGLRGFFLHLVSFCWTFVSWTMSPVLEQKHHNKRTHSRRLSHNVTLRTYAIRLYIFHSAILIPNSPSGRHITKTFIPRIGDIRTINFRFARAQWSTICEAAATIRTMEDCARVYGLWTYTKTLYVLMLNGGNLVCCITANRFHFIANSLAFFFLSLFLATSTPSSSCKTMMGFERITWSLAEFRSG